MDDDEHFADRRFFDFVELPGPAGVSLERLSGLRASDPPYATNMIADHEAAWRTGLAVLTFRQVRLLVGQQSGLQWLARPVLDFVSARPAAEADYYPGDLAVAVLNAAEAMLEWAPAPFREWLAGDFAWAEAAFGDSRSALRDFERSLARARALAGH
jgi:hypothetical protein